MSDIELVINNGAETVEEIVDDPSWVDEPEDLSSQTVIQNRYCFWYMRRHGGSAANKAVNKYEDAVKKIGSFQTVEHFWRVYDHLIRPNDHKSSTIDYHLFKNGIKPTWEDPQNARGGKWIVRLKKGLASKYWEELVLAIIGEQFDVGSEICGAVISVRGNEDILSVWNKNADNMEATNKIRDQLRRILQFPVFIPIEYKKHEDSLTDKTSFRNTVVYRPPSGTNTDRGDRGGERLGSGSVAMNKDRTDNRGGGGGGDSGSRPFTRQDSGGGRPVGGSSGSIRDRTGPSADQVLSPLKSPTWQPRGEGGRGPDSLSSVGAWGRKDAVKESKEADTSGGWRRSRTQDKEDPDGGGGGSSGGGALTSPNTGSSGAYKPRTTTANDGLGSPSLNNRSGPRDFKRASDGTSGTVAGGSSVSAHNKQTYSAPSKADTAEVWTRGKHHDATIDGAGGASDKT